MILCLTATCHVGLHVTKMGFGPSTLDFVTFVKLYNDRVTTSISQNFLSSVIVKYLEHLRCKCALKFNWYIILEDIKFI